VTFATGYATAFVFVTRCSPETDAGSCIAVTQLRNEPGQYF
jgi:hypothetical protein